MKIKRKQLSLRWRITLLMGSMILLVALILTVMSMYNAQNQMVSLVNDPCFCGKPPLSQIWNMPKRRFTFP